MSSGTMEVASLVPYRTAFTALLVTMLRAEEVYGSLGATCPTKCRCSWANAFSSLTVNCQGLADVDRDVLSEQLDALFSSNQTRDRLRSLSITGSPLTRVPRSVCRLTALTQLHLDNNRLARLPGNCLGNLTALTSLTASRNNITALQDGLFDGMRSLASLSLHHNQISPIGLAVFNGSAMLTSLMTVDMNNNQLSRLEPWPYFIGVNGYRKNQQAQVLISNNNISGFTNVMGLKFRCSMEKIRISIDLSFNYIKHLADLDEGWKLNLTTFFCVSPYINKYHSHFNLHGNFLDCDCIDFQYYKILRFPTVDLYYGTFCSNVNSLYHKRPTALTLDQFVCELTERCPTGCRCIHRPSNATLHVYCSNANLTLLPLELPALPKSYTKYKLDFSNNRHLRRMEHRDYFVNTSILDLRNCSIDEILPDVWKDISVMKKVLVDGNSLKSLPPIVATVSLSASLGMERNPWSCSCDNRWLPGWVRTVNRSLINVDGLLCGSPARLRGKSIVKTSAREFCHDPVGEARTRLRAVTIGLSTPAGAVVLLLSACIIVYRLRVKLYTRWKFRPFDRDECLGEDMDYDVFLSCSSDDNLPHGNGIRELLEQRGYRVCYPPRDFRAGESIFVNIDDAIVHSKRTVCLLTPNFPRRSVCWCLRFLATTFVCLSAQLSAG